MATMAISNCLVGKVYESSYTLKNLFSIGKKRNFKNATTHSLTVVSNLTKDFGTEKIHEK